MITLWLATGILGAGDNAASSFLGDGASVSGRGTRPIVTVKRKPRQQLEEVLELVEELQPNSRTSVKRAAVKEAREAFRAIDIPPNYESASQAISTALAKVSRAAGEYQAFQEAAMMAAMRIEALIADLIAEDNRKREKRRREEEMLLWLWRSHERT